MNSKYFIKYSKMDGKGVMALVKMIVSHLRMFSQK